MMGYVPKKAVLVDDANHEMRTDAKPQAKQLTKTCVATGTILYYVVLVGSLTTMS